MSEAERAIREKYLSDTPTVPRYAPEIAYVQLPHAHHPRPYVGMGTGTNPLRPWLLPPGVPPTNPPLVRSTPNAPTESTHVYRLPQTQTGSSPTAATAVAAISHQRQIYDLSVSHSSAHAVSNSVPKHLLREASGSNNAILPSVLGNRLQAPSTGNSFPNRYQISAPTSSFPLEHHPPYLSKHSPPHKQRRTRSPNLDDPAMLYYASKQSNEPYSDLSTAMRQQCNKFNVSDFNATKLKEDISRSKGLHRLPDDISPINERSMKALLPPPHALPIIPHKDGTHGQGKTSLTSRGGRDDYVFASPPPLRQRSLVSPSSLPSTFHRMPPSPSEIHAEDESRTRTVPSKSSLMKHPIHIPNQIGIDLEKGSPETRKRHHSEDENHKSPTVPPNTIDSISEPYSKYCTIANAVEPSNAGSMAHTEQVKDEEAKTNQNIVSKDIPCDKMEPKYHFNHDPICKEETVNLKTSQYQDISRLNAQDTRIDSKDQDEDEYPSHFKAGSLIQLSSGVLRPVEDLNTDDFIKSAELSNEVQIDQSVVVSIKPSKNEGYVMLGFSVGKEDVQVAVEAAVEHPFYVFGQGWSSISPKDTMARYKLPCKDLKIGDLCISLTHKHAERSSSHNLQHIKEETSSPPISQMPKLQPIDLNIDDRSCELIPSYNNYQRNFSGDSNDERKYPSPSSSRDSLVSPNASRERCDNMIVEETLRLQSYNPSRLLDGESSTTHEDSRMKPPLPPNNVDAIKRRSTSLSPSLTHNKSPHSFFNSIQSHQVTKERQVAFSDNVISHSPPPLSPSSDDNALGEDSKEELYLKKKQDNLSVNEKDHNFRNKSSTHENTMLSDQYISHLPQTSNGHRNKPPSATERSTTKSPFELSNATMIKHASNDETLQGSESRMLKSPSYYEHTQTLNSNLESKSEPPACTNNVTSPTTNSKSPNLNHSPSTYNDRISFAENKPCSLQKEGLKGEKGKQSNDQRSKNETYEHCNSSQHISSRHQKNEQDVDDPYNYDTELSIDRGQNHSDTKLTTKTKNISYRDEKKRDGKGKYQGNTVHPI